MAIGPWSVKGIDPRAREAAKAAAQREGLTLGEWLNQRLLTESQQQPHDRYENRGQSENRSRSESRLGASERGMFTAPGAFSILGHGDNDRGNLHDTVDELAARLEAAERRSTLAITGIDQSVLGMLTRLEGMEKAQGNTTAQLENSLNNLQQMVAASNGDIERAADKVNRVTADAEKRIDTVSRHTETELSGVRHQLSKELELANARSGELGQRIGAAERMTDNAVRTLEASFVSAEDRIRRVEQTLRENGSSGLSKKFSKRFKALSEELITVVAQTRGQLAAQIEAQSAAPRLEQFETALQDMQSQFARTERQHAQSLERITGEVSKLGNAVEQRLALSERDTAHKIDQVLDTRLSDFQNEHAVAIDKIGDGLTGAISRLEEKIKTVEDQRSDDDNLEARMIASEERTAKMIEDAMERIENQLAGPEVDEEEEEESPIQLAMQALTDRLEALEAKKDAPPPVDFSPFNPATEGLHTEAQAMFLPQEPAPEPAPEPALAGAAGAEHYNPVLEEILHPKTYTVDETPPALPPEPGSEAQSTTVQHGFDGHQAPPGFAPQSHPAEEMPFAAPAYEQTSSFEQPYAQGLEPGPPAAPHFNPGAQPAAQAPVGATADANFMAAARASVRMPGGQGGSGSDSGSSSGAGSPPGGPSARPIGVSRKLLAGVSIAALFAVAMAGGLTWFNFGKGGGGNTAAPIRADNTEWDSLLNGVQNTQDSNIGETLNTQVNAANESPAPSAPATNTKTAALAGGQNTQKAVSTVPTVHSGKPEPRAPARVAEARNTGQIAQQGTNTANDVTPQSQPTAPIITASLPQSVPATTASTAPIPAVQRTGQNNNGRISIQQAAQNGDPIAQFQLASAKIDSGDEAGGLVLLRQAANRGLPIAQYRLGKIYEDGSATITKDEIEGRRWTERAANGGNRRAMHNLAMMYAEGQGVAQSYDTAAKWFQEASLMGLTNSQYNLAFLYEQGLGVPESLTDAYAWYSIAVKAGDTGAQERVDEIGATLSPEAKAEAAKLVAQFRPRPLDLAANGVFRNVNWARPQLNTAPTIARVQTLLARNGYQPGPADGNLGDATKRAIIAYERDNGLAQTGRIDAALLAKLETAAIN